AGSLLCPWFPFRGTGNSICAPSIRRGPYMAPPRRRRAAARTSRGDGDPSLPVPFPDCLGIVAGVELQRQLLVEFAKFVGRDNLVLIQHAVTSHDGGGSSRRASQEAITVASKPVTNRPFCRPTGAVARRRSRPP